MSLFWGVVPVMSPEPINPGNVLSFINGWAKSLADSQTGDPVVIICDTELLQGVHDTVMVAKLS